MSLSGNHSVTMVMTQPQFCQYGYPDFDRSTTDHGLHVDLQKADFGERPVPPNQLDWVSPANGFCTQELLDLVLYGYVKCNDDDCSPNDREASAEQSKQLSHGNLSDQFNINSAESYKYCKI